MNVTKDRLPWRIEAFRKYLTFETLQPASSVLKLYEGETFNPQNPRILDMQELLVARTGKSAWIPTRTGSEDINWNVEGDVTRNKGRVFTSMLLLYPKEWKDGKIALTEFGSALASGVINKEQYYDFIITHFKFPHPAWKDNWKAWRRANIELYPFIYILQSLVQLHKISETEAHINTEEIADFLHPEPNHREVENKCNEIIAARQSNAPPKTQRSDEIHRKISDLLGFMCLTKYCYFKKNNIHLNLLDDHKSENAFFWESRNGQNKLDHIVELIETSVSNEGDQ